MKVIIQRVTKASVSVGEDLISSIGKGLCVLVGISRKDTPKDAEYLVRKILNLRIFDSDEGKRWDKSVMDKQYELLCVSQFTLDVIMKGNKPDFHEAMGPDLSQQFYENFLQQLRAAYSEEKIKDGKFGAMMQVHIQNDGPVTIPLESPANLQDSKKPNRKGNSSSSSLKDLPTQNNSSGTSEINNSGASGTNSDLKSAADS